MTTTVQTPRRAPGGGERQNAPLMRRLAAGLLLDLIAIGRGDVDMVDTLLASAIIQANVQEIVRRADLQVSFAAETEMPPDEMRRPVTMNAVASSLNLPFETVRRRINRMVADGFCRIVEGGVIVPSAVLADPQYAVDAFRGYERMRAGYYRMSELGLVGELPPPTVELAADSFPIRAVARLFGTYVLRVVESLARVGDLIDAMVMLEIYRANVEHLPPGAARAGVGDRGDDVADDGLRRAVASSTVATRLGLPSETVRRRTLALSARGACQRVRGGLIVPGEVLAQGPLGVALAANAAQLQRLFAALSQLGVLAVWEGLRPAP